jgi:hypothetical protein
MFKNSGYLHNVYEALLVIIQGHYPRSDFEISRHFQLIKTGASVKAVVFVMLDSADM